MILKKLITTYVLIFFLICKLTTITVYAQAVKVNSIEELENVISKAKPGDTINLQNGVWKNAEIKILANGTFEKPIVIQAEEKGSVFLEGQSYLRAGGSHLVIKGIVFRNGYTPTGEVISLKYNKELFCNHCRITECVVDDYNQPDRFESDYWVGIYGKNNRIDHCYLVGKRNLGVTMAVRLESEKSRQNFHRIDHNYFGYRPILGSNGGETLRIGTSHQSLSNSNTVVEDNYFEHCNGEHEIISNKSCQNIFRNNTFYECQGTLTMRHGNETIVENNYFFGNRKANTGGVRIINENQTVKNNYMEGLTGYRFRGALVIMNGVPDSPPNRYVQVKNSKANANIILNCDYIQLCAGSDDERSAIPINTEVNNNIFYNESKNEIFTVFDDVSGIRFTSNKLSPNVKLPASLQNLNSNSFEKRMLSFKEINGLKLPENINNIGPDINRIRPDAENTGVLWYPKKNYTIKFNTGKTIMVSPGENTIYEAVLLSKPGDIIELNSGEYHQSKTINLVHPITVRSVKDAQVVITFERSSLFNIDNGGALSMAGLIIDGSRCDDYAGNSVIRTSKYSMAHNYKFFAKDCKFKQLDVNHSFDVLRVFKSTFADSISIENCVFEKVSGNVLNLNKEIDDIGIYNVENVVIHKCGFKDVGGAALNLYRGGNDESTFGPILDLTDSTFENVGYSSRNKESVAIGLHGVQYANINNLQIKDSKILRMHLSVGDPVINLSNIEFIGSEGIDSNSKAYSSININSTSKK